MKLNEKYKDCVLYTTLEDLLDKYIEDQTEISLMYADTMGCLKTERKHIEKLKKCNLSKNCLVGLTISLRSPEQTLYTNECVNEMNTLFYETFNEKGFSVKKIVTEVYGNGNRMATSIFLLK